MAPAAEPEAPGCVPTKQPNDAGKLALIPRGVERCEGRVLCPRMAQLGVGDGFERTCERVPPLSSLLALPAVGPRHERHTAPS